MESKKLRLSQEKCFKVHICKKNEKEKCTQVLKVHNLNMKSAAQITYLGDVISETGSIDETIAQRSQKALGITTQISSILSSICLGNFHFDIAMVLRDSLFVNSVMSNSEIWHNVKSNHIESLEKSDINLLRKIMNAHSKTASEALFLELGKYPLRFVLSKRRLMYLWHVLQRDNKELIRKIYDSQKLETNKGDWCEIIQIEKSKYNITQNDVEISQMSKEKYKTMIEKKINSEAFKYLNELAKSHSKSRLISNDKFEKKPYFSDRRFSKEDVQILFALRTRTTNCKSNFKTQYGNQLKCRICKVDGSIEDEEHILICSALTDGNCDVRFSDVYGNVDEQYHAVKTFKKVLRQREVYLDMIDK